MDRVVNREAGRKGDRSICDQEPSVDRRSRAPRLQTIPQWLLLQWGLAEHLSRRAVDRSRISEILSHPLRGGHGLRGHGNSLCGGGILRLPWQRVVIAPISVMQ